MLGALAILCNYAVLREQLQQKPAGERRFVSMIPLVGPLLSTMAAAIIVRDAPVLALGLCVAPWSLDPATWLLIAFLVTQLVAMLPTRRAR